MSTPIAAPDLTKQPPRSTRVRLGNYALLPRALDKGRAMLTGKNGEYHYACPVDQRAFDFLGIDAEALKAQLAEGKGDGEILEWIKTNQKNPHSDEEIAAWSAAMDVRGPEGDSVAFFNELLQGAGPNRTDIKTWSALLDLDDYVSFGGKA